MDSFVTPMTWKFKQTETSHKYPSMTDPNAEVYTIAELIERHRKGLLTNLNIGMDAAYPTSASLDDVDLEKAVHMAPTDKFHLAEELDSQLEPGRMAAKEAAEKAAAEKAAAEAAAAGAAWAAANGYVKQEGAREGA